jgi:large subunit ribosomal protein L25
MAEIPLVVDAGRTHGTADSRRLRAAGKIPAIVYGHGMEPVSVTVDGRALRTALGSDAGTNALLRLEIGEIHHLALAREIQRHPVRHTVTHVDFQVVNRDQIVTYELAVSLVGEATAVVRADGTVDQELFSLQVKAKPGDLPSHLELDISELTIGDALRVSDIKLPDGVITDADPEILVVGAHPSKRVVAEEGEAGEGESAGAGSDEASES